MGRIAIGLLVVSQLSSAQMAQFVPAPEWQPYVLASEQNDSILNRRIERASLLGEASPARFISVDKLADKYPMFSPYVYAANNPIIFIDPTGDSIEVSRLNKEQVKAFNEGLQTMLKSRQFAKIWKVLSESKSIYSITVNPEQQFAAQFEPNSNETGSGGVISFQSSDAFSTAFAFAHEGYHAFTHDQNNPGRVVGQEIEGNLFANSVSNELGQPMLLGVGGPSSFDQAFQQLQFGRAFDSQAWRTANQLFKASGWNDGRYNSYGVKVYRPLIRNFYPLIN